ncbi:MAG: hypothetical protein RL640_98 [Bacteroidota bacterium]|jgi:hypothetical protein
MSNHQHIRKEKNCLNCGADVNGRYCSTCGQLNRVPQMEIKDLFHDTLHTILHFDGKFFNTIKLLIQSPGKLTLEYLAGKRSTYLPPIQLYLFTSAVFFFFLNTFFIPTASVEDKLQTNGNINKEDSIQLNFMVDENKYETVHAYEKKQETLSPDKRDGKLKQYFVKQEIKLVNLFEKNPKKAFNELINNFIHDFSSLFFISMPLIALWLNLIFYQKKEIGFIGHFIFIAHNYIFNYVAIFLKLILDALGSIKGLDMINTISPLFFLWIFYYGYKSIRNFYGLNRKKAIIYFSLIQLGSLLIFSILFLFYLIISLIKLQ